MSTSKTFTSASSDVSNYLTLPDAKPASNPADGSQVVRVFASGVDGGGSATLEMALVHKNNGSVLARIEAAVTATTRRNGSDGASGGYVYDVAFSDTGTDKFDLLGSSPEYGWRLGCTVLTTETSLTVTIAETPLI